MTSQRQLIGHCETHNEHNEPWPDSAVLFSYSFPGMDRETIKKANSFSCISALKMLWPPALATHSKMKRATLRTRAFLQLGSLFKNSFEGSRLCSSSNKQPWLRGWAVNPDPRPEGKPALYLSILSHYPHPMYSKCWAQGFISSKVREKMQFSFPSEPPSQTEKLFGLKPVASKLPAFLLFATSDLGKCYQSANLSLGGTASKGTCV